MEALNKARQLWESIVSGPGFAALEVADSVSGGHIKEAAKISDELFSAAVDDDTRAAALTGLDLARLHDARFRVLLELVGEMLEVQEGYTTAWSTYEAAQRPELRDLQAAAALVATGYARQTSHARRRLIVHALRGSLCPEPYLWGFQDDLLRGLIESGITDSDIDQLRKTDSNSGANSTGGFASPEIESYERLASRDFVIMLATLAGGGAAVVRTRIECPHPITREQLRIRRTHKGTKLLAMIDAGKHLSQPPRAQ